MDLHNLNIRLIEHKQIMWTCTSLNDPDDIYEELLSSRVSSGIVANSALVLSETLWLKLCRQKRFKKNFKDCTNAMFTARGVAGVWLCSHEQDPVVVLTDSQMHKEDRSIYDMSYAFVHISQVKYPRQYDAPVKKV